MKTYAKVLRIQEDVAKVKEKEIEKNNKKSKNSTIQQNRIKLISIRGTFRRVWLW